MTRHRTAVAARAGTLSGDFNPGVAPDSPHSQIRPLDAPKVHRNESAEGYSPIVAVPNGKWRVIECRDRVQWILQSRDTRKALCSGMWRGRSYCRTKEALLRVCVIHGGEINPTAAAAALAELPDRTTTLGAAEKVS
jgi:hypothetical protein